MTAPYAALAYENNQNRFPGSPQAKRQPARVPGTPRPRRPRLAIAKEQAA